MNGVIICGSATNLVEDFKKVRFSRPHYKIVGVNEAIWKIKCDMLMTCHLLELDHFLSKNLNPNIEIHTSRVFEKEKNLHLAHGFWEVKSGATSAIDAVQICQQMGFKEIIMAGCPMNGGDGYFYTAHAKETVAGCPRFGNKNNKIALKHQKKLLELNKELDFTNVFSMSGFTADLFGKPKLD